MYQNDMSEAVQIVRLLIEGLIFIIKVPVGMTTGGVKLLGKALWHAYTKDNKEIGRTNMKQMVARGGDIQLFQFDASEQKLVEKMAKQYGILYAIMPDLNKADGKMEILFHAEATPRMNALINKLNDARIISHQEYLDNAQPEEVADLEQEYQDFMERDVFQKMKTDHDNKDMGEEGFWKETKGRRDVLQFNESDMKVVMEHAEKSGISYETIPNFLKGQMQITGMLIRSDSVAKVDELLTSLKGVGVEEMSDKYVEISINEELVHAWDKDSYFTGIPGTEDYVVFDKEKCYWNESKNTFITYVEADGEIQIYAKDGSKTRTEKGSELRWSYNAEEKVPNKQSDKEKDPVITSTQEERVVELKQMSDRMNRAAYERSDKYIELSINEVLKHGEDKDSYFTRVPGTAGKDYVVFDKDKCFWNEAKNTFITYVEADEEIQIYSKDGAKTKVVSGSKLYEKYDEVENARLSKQFGQENIAKKATKNKETKKEEKTKPQAKVKPAESRVKTS